MVVVMVVVVEGGCVEGLLAMESVLFEWPSGLRVSTQLLNHPF